MSKLISTYDDLVEIYQTVLDLDKELARKATDLGMRLTRTPMVLSIGLDLHSKIIEDTKANNLNVRLNDVKSREILYGQMMANGEYSAEMPNGCICLYMPKQGVIGAADGLTRLRTGLAHCVNNGLTSYEYPVIIVDKKSYDLIKHYADSQRVRDPYIRTDLKDHEGNTLVGVHKARLGKALKHLFGVNRGGTTAVAQWCRPAS